MAEMTPADVAEELVTAAVIAAKTGTYGVRDGTRSQRDELRDVLAAVIPLIQQQVCAQQGTPRVHYGVRYPDADDVMTAPSEAIARAWAKEYGVLVAGGAPARVQRRTVTRHATDWEDVDG